MRLSHHKTIRSSFNNIIFIFSFFLFFFIKKANLQDIKTSFYTLYKQNNCTNHFFSFELQTIIQMYSFVTINRLLISIEVILAYI
jgi:hypothetical protein